MADFKSWIRPCFLLVIVALGCSAQVEDNFDVTNILRLDKNGKGGYEPFGDFYVDINGDARGLPLIRLSNPPTVDSGYEKFCCRNWERDGWEEAADTKPAPVPAPAPAPAPAPLDTSKQLNGQTMAAIWRADKAKAQLKSQPTQLPENKVCVTVIARLPVNCTLTIKIQSTDGSKSSRISTLRGRDLGYEWQLKRFETRTPRDFRRQPAVLVLSTEKSGNDPVFVQWAGFCEPSTKPQRFLVSGKFSEGNVTDEVRRVMTNGWEMRGDSDSDAVCRNGGSLNRKVGVCECAPGFAGEVCDSGCGFNKYGFACAGECSPGSKEGRGCAGFKVCRAGGCACVAGWAGERCDLQCRPGFYGSGCDLKCGSCRAGDPCDRHTGQCEDGCDDGFQPPYCHQVCGRDGGEGPLKLKDGSVADPKDFPWNVGLYDANRGAAGPQIICSGTLVTRSLVITAAHCLYNEATSQAEDPSRYIVAMGKQRHSLNATDLYGGRVQRRSLRGGGAHLPPSYRGAPRSYFDDIAVLELEQPVELSDVVRPACFDWTGRFAPAAGDLGEAGAEEGAGAGEVVGWGRDAAGNVVDRMILARPTYVPLSSCLKTVRPNFLKYLTPDKFCGENAGGQEIRRGNSGGGLLFNSFLVGVTSVAHHEDYNTIAFTNVTYHRNWLNKVRSESELRLRTNSSKT